MKYREKTRIFKATAWKETQPHPKIIPYVTDGYHHGYCGICIKNYNEHGKLIKDIGYTIVCPFDWIMEYEDGEIKVEHWDIFKEKYEKVEN